MRADHDLIPLFLVPFRWQLPVDYRANLLSPPSPPLPVLRVFVLRFATLPTLLRTHRDLFPQAHESCITVRSEMNSLTSLHRARMPKIIRPPYKFFFFAFFSPLVPSHTVSPKLDHKPLPPLRRQWETAGFSRTVAGVTLCRAAIGCQVETDETGGNPAPSGFD